MADRKCNLDSVWSLKVENISDRTTHEDLRREFEKFGHIADVHIPRKARQEGDSVAFVR